MTGPTRPDHDQAVDELRPRAEQPRPDGVRPGLAPVVAVGAGIAATVVAAWSTGAMEPLVFVEDAGPLVRWSAPVVRVVHDVAAAVTLAALVFAASLVPAPARSGPQFSAMAPTPAVRLATGAAFVWAVTALVGVVLTFADAAGLPLTDPALPPQLGELAWEIDATRIGLISAACAFVVASGAAVARGRVSAAWLAALAGFGILVLGLASHTGASDDHETSVNAMGLHLVGATVWVGGLVVLVLLHRVVTDVPRVARRYSSLALFGFLTVAASGVLAATTRLGSWGDLATPYGRLLVVKALVLAALGVAGWRHRRSTLVALEAGVRPRAFVRLALGEVVLMGVAFGVGAALSRSAPPVPEDVPDPTPALAVTGFPAPPDPATTAWWTAWRADWLWLAVAVVAIGAYAVGVVAARVASARALVESHRVGRHEAPRASTQRRASTTVAAWPWWRTACWVLGCLALAWTTSGPVGIYGRVAFSWHAALIVALAFVVAPLLVAGSPLTLAERALVPRTDGTLGPRELVVGVGRSGVVRGLTRPVVATALLLVGAFGLHATGLLDLALTTHPGHLVMVCASLVLGSLLAAAVLKPTDGSAGAAGPDDGAGPDAGPGPRVPRGVLVCLGVVVVAAFATAAWLALTTSVLAADVYGGLRLPWLRDLAAEQVRGGAVVLFVVVPVCVVLAVVVIVRGLRGRDPARP